MQLRLILKSELAGQKEYFAQTDKYIPVDTEILFLDVKAYALPGDLSERLYWKISGKRFSVKESQIPGTSLDLIEI